MLIIRRIAALFLVIIAALSFSFTAADINADNAIVVPEREHCYDSDRLLIGGYNFDLAHNDAAHVDYVKEAGIDFLISNVNKDFLDLCAERDIGVIAAGYNAPSYYYEGDCSPWYDINPDSYRDHPALWGDDLIDEPVSSMFDRLGAVTKYYYDTVPGKEPYINLFPNYANEEQLGETNEQTIVSKVLDPLIFGSNFLGFDKREFGLYGSLASKYSRVSDYTDPATVRYVKHVQNYINKIDTDYISVDFYPLNQKDMTSQIWLRNLDILAQACKKTNRDLWVITQAAGLSEEDGPRYCDTVEDIRWQMYTSMAFGAKAIIHACYDSGWWDRDSHLIDASGNRTDTYYAVQKANAEVAPFAKLYGSYDYIGTFIENPFKSAGTRTGYITPMDEDSGCTVSSDDPVLVGCFKGEKGRAYTLVNMNETGKDKEAVLTATFDGARSMTVYRKGQEIKVSGENLTLTLDNQEGVYVTVNYYDY